MTHSAVESDFRRHTDRWLDLQDTEVLRLNCKVSDPETLRHGTPKQQAALRVLNEVALFDRLREFDPVLVGTVPLDIDLATSDLDVLCEADSLDRLESCVSNHFSNCTGFSMARMQLGGIDAFLAGFEVDSVPIEIVGQPIPVREQVAYRHMLIEARLLELGGSEAREEIRRLKEDGLATEPAFARYFGLTGDPFDVLLQLADLDDNQLKERISVTARRTNGHSRP